MRLNPTIVPAFLLISATISLAVSAQDAPKLLPQSAQEQRLMQMARQSGMIAGGAEYCRLDGDDIDTFVSRAYAQIAVQSRDNIQKILARLEFKNLKVAASGKQPEGGCDKLITQFKDILYKSG